MNAAQRNAKLHIRMATAFAGCMVALIALTGCMGQVSTGLSAAQKANAEFMAQISRLYADFGTEMDGFSQAVTSNDIVSMRTYASQAKTLVQELSELEAPEVLKDIQGEYVEGTQKLQQALDAYIALYDEIERAASDGGSPVVDLQSRLDAIQTLYNEGMTALELADAHAAAK